MSHHKNLLPATLQPTPIVEQAETLVIKVGSSLVTNDGRGLDRAALTRWAGEIAQLMQQGKNIILVSSGAIAEGVQRLGWSKRPTDIHALQAAAAVGQMGLVQAYESSFKAHGIATAQILLTHEDLADRLRYLNARATLSTLLDLKVLPIINENDTVITDEIKVGDNDTLGSLVTNLIEADALIILTDQVGLYTEDPRKNPQADFIEHALATDPQLAQMAGGAGTSIGKGGMLTKIYAAQRAARSGASTVIACGREPDVLTRLAAGESIGTSLHADLGRISARKQWMADHLQLKGELGLDAGAVKALLDDGKSLLAIGVTRVNGQFNRGDVVSCIDNQSQQEIARGLIQYSAAEMRLIAGKPSHQIVEILGATNGTEIIHRDNMVVLHKS